MAKRIVTKIGNVFLVKFENSQRYFQYVANDMTMLNSSVIRIFKKHYPLNSFPNLTEVVKDEIDFYAHTVLRWGIELGFWEKVGKEGVVGEINVLFRRSLDCGIKQGEEPVKISQNWDVWRINDECFTRVGKLVGENRKSEIGVVMDAESIVHRLRTGEYDGFYPSFE